MMSFSWRKLLLLTFGVVSLCLGSFLAVVRYSATESWDDGSNNEEWLQQQRQKQQQMERRTFISLDFLEVNGVPIWERFFEIVDTCMEFYGSYDSDKFILFVIWEKFKIRPEIPWLDIFETGGDEINNFFKQMCGLAVGQFGLAGNSFDSTRGDAKAKFKVVRNNGSDGTATIDYKTEATTALPDVDYVSKSGTLTFESTDTEKTVEIDLIPDDLTQPTKYFKITIDNAIGAALLAPRTATMTIFADKSVAPNFPDFASKDFLSINGDARHLSFRDMIRLTDFFPNRAGSVFYDKAISLADGASFRSLFNLETFLGSRGGGTAFVIHNDPRQEKAVGKVKDLRLNNVENYVAVVFDMADSGKLSIVSGSNSTEYEFKKDTFDFITTSSHVWIEYNGVSKALGVYISEDETKPDYVLAKTVVDIPNEVTGTVAYFGFMASTSAFPWAIQQINSWRMDQIDPPEDPPTAPNTTIKAVTLIKGYDKPTRIAWLPDGTMLFSVQEGIIWVYDGEKVLDTPFVDIRNIVNFNDDRGLLTIAVYPKFSESQPYVYGAYTYEGVSDDENPNESEFAGPNGGGNRAGRLVRWTADKATGYRTIVPDSEEILMGKNSTLEYFNPNVDSTINFDEPPGGQLSNGDFVRDNIVQDSRTHSVGGIAFSPDGDIMYFSMGDGGSYNRADYRTDRCIQVDSLAGKVVRIDPITGEGLPDNPYFNRTNDPGANSAKVYQMGLRNPYSLTVDQSDGVLYIGDVGWDNWEEINVGGPGANFGWPYYEGGNGKNEVNEPYKGLDSAKEFFDSDPEVTFPWYAFNHVSFDFGSIHLGPILTTDYYGAELQGDLLYHNLYKGVTYKVKFDDEKQFTDLGGFKDGQPYLVDMREGPDGRIYYADHDSGLIGRWELD